MTRIGRIGPLLVGLLAVAGCAGAISGNPIQDVKRGPLGSAIVQGVQDASFNLDSAVAVGALPANDPAAKCLHDVMTQLGIDPAHPADYPSFVPRVSDLISAGSVAYIRIQQAKRAKGGVVDLPVDCQAVLGMFFIDAAHAAREALPGGGVKLFK